MRTSRSIGPAQRSSATLGFERLTARALPRGATMTRVDLRGYIGIGESLVAALSADVRTANRALPRNSRCLVAATRFAANLAGYRAGDNLAAPSAELRVPVNLPLSTGRAGVKMLVDTGTAWQSGERLRGRPVDRGVGAGVYFGGGPVIADVAVAWPAGGKPRLHFGVGVSF